MTTSTLTQAISIESIVAVVENQVSVELAGEAVILNLGSGMYYGLDPVGARIWELLQEPRTVAEIKEIQEKFVSAAERYRGKNILP